jgi:hypothetical protein
MTAMATRGRKVVLAVGAVAALAGIMVVFQWRPLAVRWYTARLEAERELLLDLCTAARDSPAYEAVQRFVLTPRGKERLLEEYLEAVFASGQDFKSRLDQVRTNKDGVWFLVWLQGTEMHQGDYHYIPNWSFRGSVGAWSVEQHIYRDRPFVPVVTALQALLLDVRYDRYPLRGDAELTFSVVERRHEGEKGIFGSLMGWKSWTEGRVALIESVDNQLSRDRRDDEP